MSYSNSSPEGASLTQLEIDFIESAKSIKQRYDEIPALPEPPCSCINIVNSNQSDYLNHVLEWKNYNLLVKEIETARNSLHVEWENLRMNNQEIEYLHSIIQF